MPDWLTAEAKDEWQRVVPGLQALELLKPEDRAVLAAYCETWAEFRNATRAIQENGSLLIDAAQGTIPHPAVAPPQCGRPPAIPGEGIRHDTFLGAGPGEE
ncbi:phage terminase small subunit P27 family [Arthrobacter sp. SDTb3-6]|uniref:phage terminase small subunit P27 family n=1 Tax=Arthrobacter sp. SDTb3-6 TaxID=2713571 RepID=UPI001C400A49|nr:phage terminase small subunit P27 family [Arthrobacter sp. SDTb3-6]